MRRWIIIIICLCSVKLLSQCNIVAKKGDNTIIVKADDAYSRMVRYLAQRGYKVDEHTKSFDGMINDALVGRIDVHCTIDVIAEDSLSISGSWTYDSYGKRLVYPINYSEKKLAGYDRKVWKWLECLMNEVPYSTQKVEVGGF